MSIITIHTRPRPSSPGTPIFAGDYQSMRHCIEAAVSLGIPLHHADLRGQDLSHASLDGAQLQGAWLDDAVCHGANLCECDLTGASATGCDLTMACLCEARLVDVDFTAASFGQTLLAGAWVDLCRFSCPTALSLPFADARIGRNFYTVDGTAHVFTAAPVIVSGLPRRLAFLDDTVMIGAHAVPRAAAPFDLPAALRAFMENAACGN